MTDRFARGSARNRARPDYARRGSFKKGHEKRGGRKRGTPNLISAVYKEAILEAAYRVGNDGNGTDGLLGYFKWVAGHHQTAYVRLLMNLLPLDAAISNTSEEPRLTLEEIDQWSREYIGLTGKNRTNEQTVQVDSQSLWDWTGQPDPVGSLMRLAVANPDAFCTQLAAAFLRPPTKRRRPAARGSWLLKRAQREQHARSDDASSYRAISC
jgi:hypothetical protein